MTQMRLLARLSICLLASTALMPAHAADLSDSSWSETDNSNTGAPPKGWPTGMFPNAVEGAARSMMGAMKRFYNRIQPTVTSGGSANVQTLTYSVAPAAYVTGDTYTFKVGTSNTGAATLNVNALGATAVQNNGTALVGGELVAGKFARVLYDGTNFQLDNPMPSVVAAPTSATDGAAFAGTSSTTYSAKQIYDWAFCNACSTSYAFDGLRGVAEVASGSTQALTNGVGGYAFVNSAISGSFPTGVALFGVGIANANSSSVWGLNTLLTDNQGQAVSAGTGKALNNELDFNITSPNTTVTGLILQGASLSQPSVSNGFACGPLSIGQYLAANYGIQWGACLVIDDNVTSVGINMGVGGTSKSAGVSSASMWQNYMDGSAVEHHSILRTTPVPGNGANNAAFYIQGDSTQIMNLGLAQGGFFTQDNASVTNGIALGAAGTSGSNIGSQKIVANYFDSGATERAWFIWADTGQIIQLASTAGAINLNVSGKYSSGGTVGISKTCSAMPTQMTITGGIITSVTGGTCS